MSGLRNISFSKHLSKVNGEKRGYKNRWLTPIFILNGFDSWLKSILLFVKIDREASAKCLYIGSPQKSKESQVFHPWTRLPF
jgi:hypothetical protein